MTPRPPIDIWVLVYPHFVLLDATGPVQVFASANDDARDAGLPAPYRIRVVARGGGTVMSSSGVALLAEELPARGLSRATLIVAGARAADLPTLDTPASPLAWLKRSGARAARCCAVCTGSFLLARCGLLDGRRAVTHWQDVAALRAEHPAVQVQDDAIHVHDGRFYTSAGITAGMDLALALVEEDLGRAPALSVARRMVMFLKRPGGQRQFSTELQAQAAPHSLAERLTAWLRPRLRQQIGVEQMAAACAVSARTLHRQLRQEAALSPAQLLARLRMERACLLLERPGMSVKQAARDSGHGSEYNLRRAFAAQLGVLPSEYQARFA